MRRETLPVWRVVTLDDQGREVLSDTCYSRVAAFVSLRAQAEDLCAAGAGAVVLYCDGAEVERLVGRPVGACSVDGHVIVPRREKGVAR